MFISAMRHRVAHTVEAVFIVLVSRESFKYMIKYTLQTVANQFLISIYFTPCTLNKQLEWPLRSGGHMLRRYVTLPRFHITRVTSYLRTFARNFSSPYNFFCQADNELDVLWPDYTANFSPGWNFNPADRAEILLRLHDQLQLGLKYYPWHQIWNCARRVSGESWK